MPVRWCAPEVFEYGKFSSQSDVWSFGVVMWEMFSYGKVRMSPSGEIHPDGFDRFTLVCIQIPYKGMSNAEVIENVLGGYRLPSPDNCPEEIYQCMIACWNEQAKRRPSFKQLYDEIERIWREMKQNKSENIFSTSIDEDSQQSKIIYIE